MNWLLLFYLLAAHALCDFPLQGDFLAKGKSQLAPIPGVPWFWCLFWHAMIHAGAVALLTHNLWLGLAELVLHFIIDDMKCGGLFGFGADQSLHVLCKLLWWVLACL